MLLNLTNHPKEAWSREQKEAAGVYGEVEDLPFPVISPWDDDGRIEDMADEYERKVLSLRADHVLLQGEYVFTYRLASRLKRRGIHVLAAASERRVIETQTPDGRTVKQSEFRFCQFREY